MRKTAVITVKGLKINKLFEKNKIIILMLLAFITGIIIGTVLFNKNEAVADLSKRFFSDYYSVRQKKAFLKIFFSSFLASLIMLLPLYISGASILGVAAVPFTVMLRGAILGSLCGYIYKTFSLKGVAFNAMILIPGTLISYVAYLFAAKISVLFSLDFIKLIFPKCRPLNLYGSFKDYTYKFLFVIIFMVLSSLVDGAFSYLFIKFFNF